MDHIIDLNLTGHYFEEYYASLLLSKILTPYSNGFMDLQSPAGAGICGAIYDYNGDVYPTDESRMLAKMGIHKFRMGNVTVDSYQDIFGGALLRSITQNSCVEILPGCSWCVYQQYCGADPIRNYSEQGDIVGYRPTSDFCKKHMGLFNHFFDLIRQNDDATMNVFWSWITKKPLEVIQGVEYQRDIP